LTDWTENCHIGGATENATLENGAQKMLLVDVRSLHNPEKSNPLDTVQ